MSCESPVKITVYEAEGFIEYVLMEYIDCIEKYLI